MLKSLSFLVFLCEIDLDSQGGNCFTENYYCCCLLLRGIFPLQIALYFIRIRIHPQSRIADANREEID